MPRSPQGPPAGWLCMAFLAIVCLGGLAGCATRTDVAAPEPGRQRAGGCAELEDLRAAVDQLHAAVSQLGADLRERDAVLGQLTERLQALEQDIAQRPRPAGQRAVLAAMDPLPALNDLVQRLRAVERRLTALETGRPEARRKGGPPLQPGLSQGGACRCRRHARLRLLVLWAHEEHAVRLL